MNAIGSQDAALNTLYHTVSTAPGRTVEQQMNVVQNVMNGVDPTRLGKANRFGSAFYLAETPETTLLELAHHEAGWSHTVRYEFDRRNASILDLTHPATAKIWGYDYGDPISGLTQSVGYRAQRAGYDAIRFPSERGPGANMAVLKNFDNLLKPQMVVQAPALDAEILELHSEVQYMKNVFRR